MPEEKPATDEKPPRTVKVVRSMRVVWPFGYAPNLPKHLGYGDIYRGEVAAWLWEHHRDAVERVR